MSKDLDKTDQMSPCSECIVLAMCKNPCYALVKYLNDKKCKYKNEPYFTRYPMNRVALGIKKGIIKLYKEDTEWYYG